MPFSGRWLANVLSVTLVADHGVDGADQWSMLLIIRLTNIEKFSLLAGDLPMSYWLHWPEVWWVCARLPGIIIVIIIAVVIIFINVITIFIIIVIIMSVIITNEDDQLKLFTVQGNPATPGGSCSPAGHCCVLIQMSSSHHHPANWLISHPPSHLTINQSSNNLTSHPTHGQSSSTHPSHKNFSAYYICPIYSDTSKTTLSRFTCIDRSIDRSRTMLFIMIYFNFTYPKISHRGLTSIIKPR